MIMICIMVAALLVGVVTGSATAECSWVLWTEEVEIKAGRSTTWEFDRRLYDTRQACEAELLQAMDSKVRVFGSLGHEVVVEGDGPQSGRMVRKNLRLRQVVAGARTDGTAVWATTYDFHCFPDTFNPRASQSK